MGIQVEQYVNNIVIEAKQVTVASAGSVKIIDAGKVAIDNIRELKTARK